MANNCYNSVTITKLNDGDYQKLKMFFNSYENFNCFSDWCESILSDENKKDTSNMAPIDRAYAYGTKWWSVWEEGNVDFEKDWIHIRADSAWSPPLGLLEALSLEFKCSIEVEFEECGMNFGGHFKYENGEEEILFDGDYREYLIYSHGIEFAIQNDVEWIEAVDDAEEVKKEFLSIQNLRKADRLKVMESFNKLIKVLSNDTVVE